MQDQATAILYPDTLTHILEGAWTVRVHSLYRHTINLKVEDYLVSLQPWGEIFTPFSIPLDLDEHDFARLVLHQGEIGRWQNGELMLPGLRLRLTGAQRWNPALQDVLEIEDCPGLLTAVEVALEKGREKSALADALLGGPTKDTALGRQFLHCVAAGAERAAQGDLLGASAAYSGLLGLGYGLTPSGDDFLCGFLAILWGVKMELAALFRRTLDAEVSMHLRETNDISAEFLRYACGGAFSSPLCSLMRTAEDPASDLTVFFEIGHASGIDTLVGVREGLRWAMTWCSRTKSNGRMET